VSGRKLTSDVTAPLFLGPLARFRKRAIYDDARLLIEAVLEGGCIACLPRLLVDASLARGQLQILSEYPRLPGSTWWLSGMEKQARSEIVLQVFNWLRAQSTELHSLGLGHSRFDTSVHFLMIFHNEGRH
jgi:DNA-binding transcriptional LysR family regulator